VRKRVVERMGGEGDDWGLTYVQCASNKTKTVERYAIVSLCDTLLFSRGLKGDKSIASSITLILITFPNNTAYRLLFNDLYVSGAVT